ncbi:MAG: copper-translocating P-type ATPase [Verrucomicrobia bacterium]|nr:copper-translocating P-type ATPase [Verrucomicrobiota bacterium]MCH8528912.1 heavy metal translocating P-type ATPase [Kiritimatiellia bacterium]
MSLKFEISGMSCSSCAATVEKAVKNMEGVRNVSVNLLTGRMSLEPGDTDPSEVIRVVEAAGYKAVPHGGDGTRAKTKEVNPVEEERLRMAYRLRVSLAFLAPLFYISMGHMAGLPIPAWMEGANNGITFAFAQMMLTLPIMYVNRKYYEVGFKTLRNRSPNMDSLVAIGTFSAFLYGVFAIFMMSHGLGNGNMDIVHAYLHDLYFEVAAVVLSLITVGKYLEAKSKGKTSEAIEKLMDLAPKKATVLRGGRETVVPVEEVLVGDTLVVKPGQSIPVDGVIVEGSSSVDQAAITGESIPVAKGAGDKVIAATMNKTGSFKFKAEKVGDDTTLARIIQLVEDANATKAPIAKLADKISGIFVPAVISIALVTLAVWLLLGQPFHFALSLGITVLVISCPCALGLATPVSIMVGTGKGAQNGILIKSAEALELLHSVDTVVLDKTGTLTEGKPVVTDILPANGMEEAAFLRLAATLEKPSEHPLADAVVRRAEEQELALFPLDHFDSVSGMGILGAIEGTQYIAGNLALMREKGIDITEFEKRSDQLASEGKTPLYFADTKKIIGLIAVADVVKPTSLRAIDAIKAMGIDVVMLTGDNKRTAEAVRKQLGIDRVVAEVLPQDKEREVRLLQEAGRRVAMVGDGINDAPALARADVGVAIGAGTDIAIDSADIVLMKNDLLDAATAIELSKATIRNIKGNLFWAFFYNVVGIPLAAGVFYPALGWRLTPMYGAAAMSLSSLFVVFNALRLRFFQPKHSKPDTSHPKKGDRHAG